MHKQVGGYPPIMSDINAARELYRAMSLVLPRGFHDLRSLPSMFWRVSVENRCMYQTMREEVDVYMCQREREGGRVHSGVCAFRCV